MRLWLGAALIAVLALACGDDNKQRDDSNNEILDGGTSPDGSSGADMGGNGDDVRDPTPDTPDTPGALTVVGVTPEDGASAVALNARLAVRFSGDVAPGTLLSPNLGLTPAVPGGWRWDAESLEAIFEPEGFFEAETRYTLNVTPQVTTPDGRALSSPFEAAFTTGDDVRPDGVTNVLRSRGYTARVEMDDPDAELRRYTMESDAPLRDGLPAEGRVVFAEQQGQMTLRSGHDLFDALFAMAIEETRLASVSSISDFAFNEGQGVPCDCFETGEKWKYVWTRDTAYAVDLGLAIVSPQRARNSLNFKLSERKGGGDLQIVQDTGSGGSWPISTDRVVWALGAWEVLKYLDGQEREAFRDRAYEAMINTIEQDRAAVYDPRDGLYLGEQSFLDWREQSYASWTASDTVHLGMSKSLSTNVGHQALMAIAAELADEKGLSEDAARLRAMAEALAVAINEVLWLEDEGMLAAMTATELDGSVLHKFELLGQSLAVLRGVVSEARGQRMVANYTHGPMGPPVLHPQQPFIPVYHNRGIWPFVTTYGLLSAREVGNDAVFDMDLASMVRGAALNLSNMENFEWLTQEAYFEDGEYSGPVINSRRQLWSVAGYIGTVVKGLVGVEASQTGLRVRPFVTAGVRNTWLAQSDSLTLHRLPYRGKTLTVVVTLPPFDARAQGGVYQIAEVSLDGAPIGDRFIGVDELGDDSVITVRLGALSGERAAIKTVAADADFRRLFAPREPVLSSVTERGGLLSLSFDADGEEGVAFNIFRDGQLVAQNLEATSWQDPDSGGFGDQTHCYAVEAVFQASGTRSHHSPPVCFWGNDRIQDVDVHNFRQVNGGTWGRTLDRPHYVDWGDPGHVLEIPAFVPRWSGQYKLQTLYGNGAGPINSGITAAVKTITVEHVATGEEVARGPVVMPHLGTWERWGDSSFLDAALVAGEVYRVRIEDHVNMSAFAHFEPYTAGPGGGGGAFNRVNITAVRFLPLSGEDRSPGTGELVTLDGDDDFGAFPDAQSLTPGVTLQPWERFAMTWDDDFLYIAVVSEGFEAPYKPFNLYFEGGGDSLGPLSAGQGIEYSGLRAALPFDATHLITVRRLSEDGDDGGPWNGLLVNGPDGWQRVARLTPQQQWWISADQHVIAMRVPRAWLGQPRRVRVAGHLVNAEPANEWKDTVPATHTPWTASNTGFFEIDLDGPTPVSGWLTP